MDLQEFISKYSLLDEKTGCFNWIRGKTRKGYGQVTKRKNRMKAHRLSFILANGPFDSKLHVLHKCDNPSCINPDHLYLGTNWDNVLDCHRKGRAHHPMKWILDKDGNRYFGQYECSIKTGLTRKQVEKRLLGLVKNDPLNLHYA